jgi:hypothetical protein
MRRRYGSYCRVSPTYPPVFTRRTHRAESVYGRMKVSHALKLAGGPALLPPSVCSTAGALRHSTRQSSVPLLVGRLAGNHKPKDEEDDWVVLYQNLTARPVSTTKGSENRQ